MATRFALLLQPAPVNERVAEWGDTFSPLDPGAPALSVGELSTQRGDGIFESIGVVDGHPQEVGPHLERLAHSAALCDLPAPNLEQWRAAVELAAASCPPGEAVLKLILSRGIEHGPMPTAWVTASDAADFTAMRTGGIGAVVLDRGIDADAPTRAPWLLLGAKTLSYAVNMAAIREARRRGADDAIFATSDGFVLEGPTSSVMLRLGDRFVTPEPGVGILRGTTQVSLFAHLSALGDTVETRRVTVQELRRADALWLVSSVRLAVPVHTLDGTPVPVDVERTAAFTRFLLRPRD